MLTLVRFASLSVRTDLWGPLVASLLVENTQRTLLDIKLTSKWFGLPIDYFMTIFNVGQFIDMFNVA